ncbi:MAG: TatD family hydrolase [Gammaproteobacteria bacterium]|nr:TatD family hydrolase [Gammaproteobacteria bacterium]
MTLIDTHCHIDVAAFDDDRERVLARCEKADIGKIVVPGIRANSWDALLLTCSSHPMLFPALGLHPAFLKQHSAQDLDKLAHGLHDHRPVAVGEIGLDFYRHALDRDAQQVLFEAQLALAQNAALPVLLHVRKAHDQVLSTLRRFPVKGGICHAFNGSEQQAMHYIELGFKLGFGGMLTYERASKLRSLAAQLPLEAIVLETDAPDMTVASHHGERNSPEYLPECLQTLATLRTETIDTIAAQTTRNAEEVLSLKCLTTPS